MRISDWSSDVCSSDLCRVKFPAAVAAQLRASGLKSAKGGIVETAIIAGTMAVKRTHELIPFCHPLPIDGVRIGVDWHGERELRIECAVKTTHRTGVEMEALTGATVAALTVYDMCTALSHAIRSEEHTSELQSLMRISYAVFCLKNKNNHTKHN